MTTHTNKDKFVNEVTSAARVACNASGCVNVVVDYGVFSKNVIVVQFREKSSTEIGDKEAEIAELRRRLAYYETPQ